MKKGFHAYRLDLSKNRKTEDKTGIRIKIQPYNSAHPAQLIKQGLERRKGSKKGEPYICK